MPTASIYAVVPALNESKTIGNVLRQLQRAGVSTIFVLTNGSTDNTLEEAKITKACLTSEIYLLSVDQPLGHDVPRAVATLHARCHLPKPAYWLYVDSDWGGMFGPMLHSFISEGMERSVDGYWSRRSRNSPTHPLHSVIALWEEMARRRDIPAHLADIAPYQVPLLVRDCVFDSVSPTFLATPIRFFRELLLYKRVTQFTLAVDNAWDMRLVGHRSTNRSHHKKMQQALFAETKAFYCTMATNEPLTDVTTQVSVAHSTLEYLHNRKLDWLHQFAANPTYYQAPADDVIQLSVAQPPPSSI